MTFSTGDDLSIQYVNGVINNYNTKKTVLLVSDQEGEASSNYDVMYESRYKADAMDFEVYNLGTSYGLEVLKVR